MKLIVIDVGNTSTAVGLWTDGRVSRVSHVDGDREKTFAAVKKLSRLKGMDAIGYVSVVPSADDAFESLASSLSLPFAKITVDDFTLKLDYRKPETIGADRLADAAGAVKRYGAPVLVMDFGTALTAAVVTADGVWRGGVIAPGFPLMRDYLFERTAKLPKMKLGSGKAPKIGRSTLEAMRFGALVGYRGMVREIVAELEKNFAQKFRLIATGGFAKWALADAGMDFTLDCDLTLYGTGLMTVKRLEAK